MRGGFLSPDQQSSYCRYAGEPSPEQLAGYFHLDDEDVRIILLRRGEHNRFGFAVQLATVRFFGTFLSDPNEVPEGAVSYAAAQLDVDPASFAYYSRRITTHNEHAARIRSTYGYENFGKCEALAEPRRRPLTPVCVQESFL